MTRRFWQAVLPWREPDTRATLRLYHPLTTDRTGRVEILAWQDAVLVAALQAHPRCRVDAEAVRRIRGGRAVTPVAPQAHARRVERKLRVVRGGA